MRDKLEEATRKDLVNSGKRGASYSLSNQSKGKNRYERRKHSSIATNVAQYNEIDMNSFFKNDVLSVGINVRGETDNYVVNIKFGGILEDIKERVIRNDYKLEFKIIVQALTSAFNQGDVYIHCDCKDFKYRFGHYALVGNFSSWSASDLDSKPARGDKSSSSGKSVSKDRPDITNPDNDKGSACKHVLLVLSNADWLMKVASVINNYIKYAEEHMQRKYADIIFPKIYGMTYNKAVQLDIFDTDDDLQTDKEVITTSNKLGRTRGRFSPKNQPGRATTKEKQNSSNVKKDEIKFKTNNNGKIVPDNLEDEDKADKE